MLIGDEEMDVFAASRPFLTLLKLAMTSQSSLSHLFSIKQLSPIGGSTRESSFVKRDGWFACVTIPPLLG
jgi:hypothetical protein